MIEVQSLSRYYGNHQAVREVSFSIAAHQVVGFLGLNGAGKSTTLKVIAGLLPPTSGSVHIDGVDVTAASISARSRIGFLPEDPPLYKEMTVSEFLQFLGRLRGMSSRQLSSRIPEVLSACQLDEQEHRVIAELSHGYRKRVGIAQAILHKPQLVILDEPISGLDPYQIVEMRKVIRGLATESTVLVSSHNLSEISQISDRVLVLNRGQLIADTRLEGNSRLRLVLRGERAALESTLSASAQVAAAEVLPGEGGQLKAWVELVDGGDVEALVVELVGAGIGVRYVGGARDELEEVFMDLIRKGAA